MNFKNMKKYIIILLCAAVLAGACAKQQSENKNIINKEVLDAWISTNYPLVSPTGCGIYVLEDVPGTGKDIGEGGYIVTDYTSTSIAGFVSSTTDETTAKKVDMWSASAYYGPVVQRTGAGNVPSGINEMLKGMKVGGRRKALIPSWLLTTDVYSTPEEYLNKVSTDLATQIYDVTAVDYTDDILQYNRDNIDAFCKENYPSAEVVETGFWYCRTGGPSTDKAMPSDTTVKINYTGRLLNGKVFDTTKEQVAKDAGIYSKSATYKPVSITWGSAATDLKMTVSGSSTSTTPISGFQKTLWQMHPGEKGVGLFDHEMGYGEKGSGAIPAYAPLIFEIELVKGE